MWAEGLEICMRVVSHLNHTAIDIPGQLTVRLMCPRVALKRTKFKCLFFFSQQKMFVSIKNKIKFMNFLRKNIFVKKVWRTANPSYEMVDQTAYSTHT